MDWFDDQFGRRRFFAALDGSHPDGIDPLDAEKHAAACTWMLPHGQYIAEHRASWSRRHFVDVLLPAKAA